MKLRTAEFDFKPGESFVDVWAVLHTTDDCDMLIAWLQLAKHNIRQWEKIRAKAARAAQAASGKNENHQPRQAPSAPCVEVGEDGVRARKTA